mgnify:CR=1 FL=1|jgi:hypothetical protein
MSKYKVVVELVGGVATVIECPPEVEVEIRWINHWQKWRQEQKLIKDRLLKK